MSSWLEAVVNAAGMAVLAATAAAQLYHAWRALEGDENGGSDDAAARRRRRAAAEGGSWGGWGGGGAPGRWRAVRRGREVRILTPSGQTALVFLGSADALEQLGLLGPDGALPPELGGGGGDGLRPGSAAARVAALAGAGREFGPEDYETLAALDNEEEEAEAEVPSAHPGLRHRRGHGGRGGRVTPADVDRLPTHAYRRPRPPTPPPATTDGGGGELSASSSSAPSSCPICLAPWEGGETLRTLPCLHHFCAECVDPWLLGHGRGDAACPVCKTLVFASVGQED
jgi:hypothetical protein